MHPIQIGLAADQGYFCGLLATAGSIAIHAREDAELRYNILDGGICEKDWAYLQERITHFHSKSSFNRIPVDESLFKEYPAWHGNKMAYARLMLPYALPEVDWIVYCDVDFLWLRDIAELWAVRDDALAFIGTLDPSEITRASEKKWFEERGYPFSMDDYFCSGLCFMNLKAFRDEKMVDKIKEILDKHKDIRFPDQAALNIVTYGRRKLVEDKWQRFIRFLQQDELTVGVVLHFAGAIPWMRTTNLINPLGDATMIWHQMNAKIRGISIWRSLRMWFPVYYVLWHRAIYWMLQPTILRAIVKSVCLVAKRPGIWWGLDYGSRRLRKDI